MRKRNVVRFPENRFAIGIALCERRFKVILHLYNLFFDHDYMDDRSQNLLLDNILD